MTRTSGSPTAGTANSIPLEVVATIADTSQTDALDLPPLEGSVDTEALGRFVASIDSGEVTFAYHDHRVTVDAAGSVTVESAD